MSANSFFIAGEQRSGTTLLSVILSRHSGAYIDGYSVGFRLVSCFSHFSTVLPYNGAYSNKEIQSWLIKNDYKGRLAELLDYENLDNFSSAQTVIQDGIDRRLAEHGKVIFGDKSPGIHHFMSDVLALIPKARFIHVVRDGRAVAYSQYSRTGKLLSIAAQDWVDGISKGITNQAWVGKEAYHMVRYEDLVEHPEKTVRAICDFLEIPFEPQMMEASDHDEDNYVLPTFEKSKIEGFREKLSERQLYKAEKIMAPMLERLNYELYTSAKQKPHKQLSVGRRILLNQQNSIKRLFISKRKGMQNRKVVDVKIPLRVRVKKFLFEVGGDFLSERAFKRVFRKKWIRKVYIDK